MSSAPTPAGPHDELQYLNLIRSVLDTGESRPDRTGTGTISIFAPPSLRFSLANSTLPLLTTKRTFLRGIIEELLWFIKGQTDSTLLSKKGVKIWDGNGSKEFLEKRGLGHRRAGDLGPVYGFQWRHFGAEYVDADADYTGKGVDQLREVIRKIKEDPTDRRIILSAWNPAGLPLTRFIFRMCTDQILHRYTTYGFAALSHDVPVLRALAASGQPNRTAAFIVPHVSTLRGLGARNPFQHRVLRTAYAHDRMCHGYDTTRAGHTTWRCSRLPGSCGCTQRATYPPTTHLPYSPLGTRCYRH
jgi:Thymidylate synthase